MIDGMARRPARLALALVFLGAGTASAQIPDKFTNLQVLPKDISKAQLTAAMRSFAGALGVRCNHCHVEGPKPGSLEGMDFAADTKETKKIARAMLKMTGEINTRFISQLGRTPVMEVRCVTCHRGMTKPETLVDVLRATAKKDGVEAAIKQYRDLREKQYGRGGYDFGAPTLNQLAEGLAEQDVEGAIAVQKLNVEVNPTMAGNYGSLGRLYEKKGDRAAAKAAYERAAAIDPAEEFYKKKIEELGKPAEEPKKP